VVHCIHGKEVKLDVVAGATTATIQDWEKLETKEKVLLRMFVKYSLIPHIRDCTTSMRHGKNSQRFV
jgi:hypothetical protein